MDFSVQISDLGLAATEHAEYKVSPLLVSSAWLSSVKTGVSRLLSQKGHTSSYIEERKHTQTTHNMQCLGWLTLEVFLIKLYYQLNQACFNTSNQTKVTMETLCPVAYY